MPGETHKPDRKRLASEEQIVARIRRAFPSAHGRDRAGKKTTLLRLGIGDDAAILSPHGRSDWALSCDAFLEGVHFLADRHPADSVGFKSLARATSDLAAMGAIPRYFLLTLAIPAHRTQSWLDQFLRGMARAARSLGIQLAGGDTTRSPHISISITVLGDVPRGHAVRRGGAKPGDLIYVSGALGRAQLGWELLQREPRIRTSLRRHLQPQLYPEIRVELGAWLARNRIASAMMDLSDGLSTDLARLCAASHTGARIRSENVPCVAIPRQIAGTRTLGGLRLDPLELALHGGEDYELLFTVPPRRAKRLAQAPGFRSLVPIGEITRGRRILVIGPDGRSSPLKPGGWDPFSKHKIRKMKN